MFTQKKKEDIELQNIAESTLQDAKENNALIQMYISLSQNILAEIEWLKKSADSLTSHRFATLKNKIKAILIIDHSQIFNILNLTKNNLNCALAFKNINKKILSQMQTQKKQIQDNIKELEKLKKVMNTHSLKLDAIKQGMTSQ